MHLENLSAKKLIKGFILMTFLLILISCGKGEEDFKKPRDFDKEVMEIGRWDKKRISNRKNEIFLNGTIFCFYSVFDKIDLERSNNREKKLVISNQNLFNNYAYLLGYSSVLGIKKVDQKKIDEFAIKKLGLFINDSFNSSFLVKKCADFVNSAIAAHNLPNKYDMILNEILRLKPEYFTKQYDMLKVINLQNDFRLYFNKGKSDVNSGKQPELKEN